jgi:hypothetical protein
MCGDAKRSAVRRDSSGREGAVNLCYSGRIAVRVRGVATGRLYRFSRSQPSQWVDRQDAPPLLQTQLFREIECQ